MLSLVILAIAYQIENKKFRYLFLILAGCNLAFNFYTHAWVQDLYAFVIAILLYTLNPYFLYWWQRRNLRNNPSSLLLFAKSTLQIAKYNKFLVFSWILCYAILIAGIIFYTKNTGYTLLGWLVGICVTVYIFKNLFYSILPPEWFLHDINTGYVFLGVFTAWIVSAIMIQKLDDNFILPMLLTGGGCLIGTYFTKGNTRFFVPGCAIILADIVWQIVRYSQSNMTFSPQFIATEAILIVAIVIGLRWLIVKPNILPIAYLALFQLFRFSAFTYQAVDRSISDMLTAHEVTYYILYLVCWMYIAPMIFWFSAVMQRNEKNLY